MPESWRRNTAFKAAMANNAGNVTTTTSRVASTRKNGLLKRRMISSISMLNMETGGPSSLS